MANAYAANFGDVVKHTVLCEALTREQPARYLESHGGRLDYDLTDLEPGPGGVWDFIELSANFDALASSAYAQIIRDVAGQRQQPTPSRGRGPVAALYHRRSSAGADVVQITVGSGMGTMNRAPHSLACAS
jgi:hypothetical protein